MLRTRPACGACASAGNRELWTKLNRFKWGHSPLPSSVLPAEQIMLVILALRMHSCAALPMRRQLGYKQELRRELNLLRNFAVSFGLLSMLTGLGGFYYYAESFNIDTDEGVGVWGVHERARVRRRPACLPARLPACAHPLLPPLPLLSVHLAGLYM